MRTYFGVLRSPQDQVAQPRQSEPLAGHELAIRERTMPVTKAMTQPPRGPALWGAIVGGLQAASPLAFWWLDPATVYALGLVVIASVYIGFAVADGRQTRVVVESGVAAIFVVVAAAGVTGSAWLLALASVGMASRIFGSTAPSLSLILGGGRRFASSSIGSLLRSSPSRLSRASTSTTRDAEPAVRDPV